jgi:hypothetical protein
MMSVQIGGPLVRAARAAVSMPVPPEIQSIGPPHPIHTDRIIAAILRSMAEQHARVWETIYDITHDPHIRDGNPKAQARLEAKVRAAGADCTVLIPGKRGRYTLYINSLCGWDPTIGKLIEPDTPLPPKPWISCLIYRLEGTGNGNIKFAHMSPLYISHHALSRSAQRWGVRTTKDLAIIIEMISTEAMRYITDRKEKWAIVPPEGARITLFDTQCTLVLQRYEEQQGLAVVTVL